ncbi:hypothetical protein [Sporisorium scitamineum]|uniref:Uncharacterized protein n=1 Tax=Sporisorium scitamineum TaxID=49012 RepID=A0A0F7S2Z0_9BASI|nr:hypothetical protein [Sporisorium scitamineum]
MSSTGGDQSPPNPYFPDDTGKVLSVCNATITKQWQMTVLHRSKEHLSFTRLP